AAALGLHDRRRVLHAEEDATQEHADGLVEAGHGDLLDGPGHAGGAGVVEKAIEPAEPSHGLGDRRLHVRLAADVGVHVGRATADLGGQPLAAVVLEGGGYAR